MIKGRTKMKFLHFDSSAIENWRRHRAARLALSSLVVHGKSISLDQCWPEWLQKVKYKLLINKE